jgi:hypothetical protein
MVLLNGLAKHLLLISDILVYQHMKFFFFECLVPTANQSRVEGKRSSTPPRRLPGDESGARRRQPETLAALNSGRCRHRPACGGL